jgi:hypothetical protein
MKNLLTVGLLATTFINTCEAADEEKMLCSSRKEIIFNCETKKHKIISLCESGNPKTNAIQYKFGTLGKIDFSYTSSKDSKNKFHKGKFQGGSVATDLVWFQSGPFTYSIFSPDTGADGVAVIRDGKLISSQQCIMKSRSGLVSNSALIQQATEDEAADILAKIMQ